MSVLQWPLIVWMDHSAKHVLYISTLSPTALPLVQKRITWLGGFWPRGGNPHTQTSPPSNNNLSTMPAHLVHCYVTTTPSNLTILIFLKGAVWPCLRLGGVLVFKSVMIIIVHTWWLLALCVYATMCRVNAGNVWNLIKVVLQLMSLNGERRVI